jgi:hypothetical protein
MSYTPYSDDLLRQLVNLYNRGTIKRTDLCRFYVVTIFSDPTEFPELSEEIDQEYYEMHDPINNGKNRSILEKYKLNRAEQYIKMSPEDRFKRDFVSALNRKSDEEFRRNLNNELEGYLDIIRWRLWRGGIDFDDPDNSDESKHCMTNEQVTEMNENEKFVHNIVDNMKESKKSNIVKIDR